MLVKQLMQIQVVTIHPEETLRRAAERMLSYRVSGLPVVDRPEHMIGLIHFQDVLHAPFPEVARVRIPGIESEPSWARRLSLIRVGEIMATEVVSVQHNDPLLTAVMLIIEHDVHPLPVLHDGRLVGILSRATALRAILNYRLEE